MDVVDSDNSDFNDLYESSEDEFQIRKSGAGKESSSGQSSDSSSQSSSETDDEPLSKMKIKFSKQRKTLVPRTNYSSSDSDTPLASYVQKSKQKP